jgi:hypothetical protein
MKMVIQEESHVRPESLVPEAKASSAIGDRLPFSKFKIDEARLVFDSTRQTSGAAVRSGAVSARQLLYKSGSVCIDMHIQPKLGSISALVTGQLLDSKRHNRAMRDIPVSLIYEGDTISHKKTNAVGEFDFGVDTLRHLQLAFGISKRRMVMVVVPCAPGEPPLQSR